MAFPNPQKFTQNHKYHTRTSVNLGELCSCSLTKGIIADEKLKLKFMVEVEFAKLLDTNSFFFLDFLFFFLQSLRNSREHVG